MTLGNRIKAARERLKPKPRQADIAEQFGVTVQAVSQWERGETIPEFEKLADLAILLKVPCLWLLKGRGAPPDPDALEVAVEELTAPERAVVNATIQALRKQRGSVA